MPNENQASCGACGQHFSNYEALNTHKIEAHNMEAAEYKEQQKLENEAAEKAVKDAGLGKDSKDELLGEDTDKDKGTGRLRGSNIKKIGE